ncbi:TPA: sigma-70 family RNA polymerase sigma factor [Yersinia enterocolitica]|uniref:sigma-70 family RNA polymerase sigma factor n=1 Tax=Yersinia enterocolitica TaxID=630 RepID=UPI0028B45FD5|nr:sigma-70 family RNA polymerase sigma factor [Yersinia enterocolitica]ELI8203507.1 sigma-70 family RNA polymerase sigma factor [Yersinia enterocolitica]ELY5304044.1 sigma-70 family RNA polymerase sigma factor [Yersinia enterocolitica]HDL6894042.1 sigma-70 family RNA polymerase sigma factor [Yersinia enterocolitica]HDM8275888.1 sigma-70 family RNA polymerase sigma factor [Yersinia enterocolitica]
MDSIVGKLNPLLRLAAISGVEAAVTFHILRGDDLDARDSSGSTPLILAASRKNSGAVRLLLDAGANPMLVDPKGMNALAYALRANCPETVGILSEAFNMSPLESSESEEVITENQEEISSCFDKISDDQASGSESHAVGKNIPTFPEYHSEFIFPKVTTRYILDVAPLSLDPFPLDAEFEDYWEVEINPVAPVGDQHVAELVKNVHKAIGQHKAVDNDEDWGDVDLYLPVIKSILGNGRGDYTLRTFLLAAIRDGVVSKENLVEICLNPDGSRNEDFERFIGVAVGELGAIVDEQSGATINDTSLDESSLEEKLLLEEAIEFIKDLASDHNEPFRFYSKDIRCRLLEAQEEIALSREMEEAWQDVLSVLAQWPEGLAVLFDNAEKVLRGEADAGAFSTGPDSVVEDEATEQEDVYDEDGEEKEHDAGSAFVTAIAAVRSKVGDFQRTKEALEAAKLTRGFLYELAERAKDDSTAKGLVDALERQSYARDRMIQCNLRLALSIAKKHRWSGVPIDDLVQEANIGLMKAAERYDWRRGFRFSTYATWWIRQQITRSIADKSRCVRAPVHIQDKAWKIIRERDDIELRGGYPELNLDTAKRLGMPLSKLWTLLSMFDDAVSLDEIGSNMECARVDLLVNQNDLEPSRLVEQSSLCSTLSGMLEELDARSRAVILYRFGLGNIEAMTLEEVGQIFGVTRERIRQIEFKAICKLSSEKRKEILAPFMGEDDYQ